MSLRKSLSNKFSVINADHSSPELPAASVLQPGVLGRMNEQAVLRTILSAGPLSRIEIARQMGITAPTASKAVDSLMQMGWLEENTSPLVADQGRGRPGKKVGIPSEERAQLLGAVLDARRCRVVAAGLSGKLRENDSIAFDTPDSYEELINRIVAAAKQLATRTGCVTFGMGISVPGLIDNRQQKGVLSPNLPITNGRSPIRDIQKYFDFPCVQVQEEHALCLAERAFGAARGMSDFAMLDVSTGVGLGVVMGGRLLTGHRGLAGELGHITAVPDGGRLCGCGNHGCLETEASDTALTSSLSNHLGRLISIEELATLVRTGELNIDRELDRSLKFLAIGVATVINLFNISTLFVHGEMFAAFPNLFPRLIAETQKRALAPSFQDCQIIRTRGSKRLGAIAGILEHLIDSLAPSDFSNR